MINTWEELKEKVRNINTDDLTKFCMDNDSIIMYNDDVTFIFDRGNGVYVETKQSGYTKIINFCTYEIMSHLIDCLMAVE